MYNIILYNEVHSKSTETVFVIFFQIITDSSRYYLTSRMNFQDKNKQKKKKISREGKSDEYDESSLVSSFILIRFANQMLSKIGTDTTRRSVGI